VAIAAGIVNFAVQGFSMALSSINSVGLFQSIQNGFTALGTAIWEGVAHVGQFLKEGFTFLTDVFTGNFSALGAGITDIGNFVMDGVKIMFDPSGALVRQNLTFGQVVGRNLIAAAINIPVSKGLEGLGIDSTMGRLAGAFISGGIAGLGAGASGFLQSGMQSYLLQGVSEIGLKLDLPPPIAAAISVAVNASLAGFFDSRFILRDALPQIFPLFAQQLVLGGIELLGRSLGLDPRITELIGLPLAAAVGNITGQSLGLLVGYRSDGTPIYVTNPYDTGSIWDSITGALISQTAQAVGFDFGGITSSSIFGSLLSSDILSSLGSILGSEGLFDGILDILKTVIFAPVNAINGIAQAVLNGIQDFGALIQEKGLIGAFESLATSIFSRQTIEKLLGAGGIGGFISSAAKIPTTLNGQNVMEQKLDSTTSLFYDLAGNFIGKKENGVTQLGTFGFNSMGKWALLAGSFIADMVGGWAFAGDVQDGQLKRGKLYDSNGIVVGEFTPENEDGSITIDGRYPDAQQFDSSSGFWGMVFKLIPLAMDFVFRNGLLQQATAQTGSGSSQSGEVSEDFYVLANGINNDSGGVPAYIRNLEYALYQQSNQEIVPGDDTLPIDLYHPTIYQNVGDGAIDVLKWALESQSPTIHWELTLHTMAMLAGSAAALARPIVAMGYSGGLLPLLEGIARGPYNVQSVVGLGAATLSLASSEIFDALLAIVDFAQSSIGKVVGWFTGALDASLRFLLEKLHLEVLNVGHLADELVDLVSQGSSLVIDKLREIIAVLPKIPAWNFPTIINQGADTFVNVYGTNDILYQTGIGGYRDSLFGFSVNDSYHPLFNVEIVGADHFDYMKDDDSSDPTWNQTVSDFVALLMVKSQSTATALDFFNRPPAQYQGCFSYENNRWVVRLPGWQAKEQT